MSVKFTVFNPSTGAVIRTGEAASVEEIPKLTTRREALLVGKHETGPIPQFGPRPSRDEFNALCERVAVLEERQKRR